MTSAFALAWRLHRWEIAAIAIAAVAVSAFALSIVPELDQITATCRAATEVVAPCGSLTEMGVAYSADTQYKILLVTPLIGALPFAAGVLLGAPLVARELEHGTALVGWSLARSRARWLTIRFLPLVAIGLVLMAIPAMAGEILERSVHPVIDPAVSFEHYGSRGPLLAVRFLPAVAVGALVGAVVGRQLPSLLVAGALVGAMTFGLGLTPPLWLEAEEQSEVFRPIETVGSLFAYVRYRDADGSWISEEEYFAQTFFEEGDEPDPSAMPHEVLFVIPGERYPEVVLRESGALVAAALAVSALLLWTVMRRRPG
jgi:hypothetical protein